MAQSEAVRPCSGQQISSPPLLITTCDERENEISRNPTKIDEKCLAPNRNLNESFSESDRYYTASSGDDSEYVDGEDDVDEGLCIRLDSDDDDDRSLSGLHINLKTLQAVSSMLAHYNPVIQSDTFGNPTFVAPPPPEDDYTDEEEADDIPTPKKASNSVHQSQSGLSQDDCDYALQQLDDVIIAQDKSLLSDTMSELTNVMEKMTRFNEDCSDRK